MLEPVATDADLWQRARREPSARTDLCARVQEVAERELRCRGAPLGSLGDLVQETQRATLAFLEAHEEEPRDLQAFLKFRAWGVLSDHRKRMRRRMTEERELDKLGSREPRGPDARELAGELESALADCRGRLDRRLAVVVELRYDARLEAEVIARELGIHRNTVNVRVFRALAQLRECLTRKGFAPGDVA